MVNFIILNRENISYIHRVTGIRKQTISKKLISLGYIDRTQGRVRTYTCNENIFHDINSIEKAYYLGLLAADGSLNRDSNLIRLSLSEEDYYLLEQFNAFIESNRPIYKHKDCKCCEVCINSRIMQQDLINKGIGYNKSYTLKAPNIDDIYGKSFVLGLFDGDGNISISNNGGYETYCFRITGTKDILKYAIKFLYIYDNKYNIQLEHNCSVTYQLRVDGNYRVYCLLQDLYNNNYLKSMRRKYDRFLKLQAKAPKRRNSFSKLS